jgi:superfamily II DNA or RNA helicase
MAFIDHQGIHIPKEIISKELDSLKKELTVSSFFNGNLPTTFGMYIENKNELIVPVNHPISQKIPVKKLLVTPEPLPDGIRLKGTPLPHQVAPISCALKTLRESGGGILSVYCGGGKTFMAINIIKELNVKAMIVVHKTFLLDQWKQRIAEFLPGAKVGIIQSDKFEVDSDIVIAMVHSLVQRGYSQTELAKFQCVIYDEVHRFPCEYFSKVMFKLNTRYRLGLSATPYRADGLSRVLTWFIGPVFYTLQSRTANYIVKVIPTYTKESAYKPTLYLNRTQQLAQMLTHISQDYYRTKMIAETLTKLILEGRKVLLLSHRLAHLNEIQKLVETMTTEISIGYYVGNMKKEALEETKTKQLILGTYMMASEGMDIADLDTLILATPTANIQQAAGRILRKGSYTTQPLIIDFIDKDLKSLWQKRRDFYMSQDNFEIEGEPKICKAVENLFLEE